MQTLTQDQLQKVARILATGTYGAFATTIGEAYLLADLANKETLTNAFADLFHKVYIQSVYCVHS